MVVDALTKEKEDVGFWTNLKENKYTRVQDAGNHVLSINRETEE